MRASAALDHNREHDEVPEISVEPFFLPREEDEETRLIMFGRATRLAQSFTRGFWGTRSLMNGEALNEEQRAALRETAEAFTRLAEQMNFISSAREPSIEELGDRCVAADRKIFTTLHAELTAWSAGRARAYDPVAAATFFANLAATDGRTRWNGSLLADAHELLVRATEVVLGFGLDRGGCF